MKESGRTIGARSSATRGAAGGGAGGDGGRVARGARGRARSRRVAIARRSRPSRSDPPGRDPGRRARRRGRLGAASRGARRAAGVGKHGGSSAIAAGARRAGRGSGARTRAYHVRGEGAVELGDAGFGLLRSRADVLARVAAGLDGALELLDPRLLLVRGLLELRDGGLEGGAVGLGEPRLVRLGHLLDLALRGRVGLRALAGALGGRRRGRVGIGHRRLGHGRDVNLGGHVDEKRREARVFLRRGIGVRARELRDAMRAVGRPRWARDGDRGRVGWATGDRESGGVRCVRRAARKCDASRGATIVVPRTRFDASVTFFSSSGGRRDPTRLWARPTPRYVPPFI